MGYVQPKYSTYMNAQYYKGCAYMYGSYDNFQLINLIKDRSLQMRLPKPHFLEEFPIFH